VKNRYGETHFSVDRRFSIGNDLETGGHYLAIPVSNGVVDYDEQYYISAEQYHTFAADLSSAADFLDGCRRREHDDQLIYVPLVRRGSPI
jgi:hypothetical protein